MLTQGGGKKEKKKKKKKLMKNMWNREKLKWRKKVVFYLGEACKYKIKIRSLIPSPPTKFRKEEPMTLSQFLLFLDELWRRICLWKKNKDCQVEQEGLIALIAPEKLIVWGKDRKMKLASTAFAHIVICVNGLNQWASNRAVTPKGKAWDPQSYLERDSSAST